MPKIQGTTRTEIHHFEPDDPRLVIITDPTHRLFDPRTAEPPTEEFIQSVIKEGVIEPIIVTKMGDSYVIVNGRKRLAAAREALARGVRHKVKVMPKVLSEYEQLKTATITNVQRVDDSPIIRGRNAQRLLDNGADMAQLESIFGAKANTIQGWIALYHAPEVVKKAVSAGEITPTDAVKAARKVRRGGEKAVELAVKDAKQKTENKKERRRKFVFTATEVEPGVFSISCSKDVIGDDMLGIREAMRNYLG